MNHQIREYVINDAEVFIGSSKQGTKFLPVNLIYGLVLKLGKDGHEMYKVSGKLWVSFESLK